MKRLASLVLALALALTLAVPVMAAGNGTITVENPVENQTYVAYKIFDVTYSGDAHAYTIAAYSEWYNAVRGYNGLEISAAVDGVCIVAKKSDYSAADFAAHLKNNLPADAESTPLTKTGETVKATGLDLGYYFVTSTTGSLCSLDTTNPNAVVQEKNEVPSITKEVQEGSSWGEKNDANIGDTVNFKATITVKKGAENYVLHDTMSAGLTYNKVDSVKIGETDVAASSYTVKAAGTDGCTFEVAFDNDYIATLADDTQIVVYYSATLNQNAVVAGQGNSNEVVLSYGDNGTTEKDTTVTYTWDVDIFKYTMVESEGGERVQQALPGAKFTLSKNANGESPINLIKKADNTYCVAKTGETGTLTEIITDGTCRFTVEGLDADTYYLTETEAPAGYNKLPNAITITIDNTGKVNASDENSNGVTEIQVENNTGTELPSTGGMGTTLFYALGGILVIGAGVALVTKKRMA